MTATCSSCNESFSRRSNLIRHISRKHSTEPRQPKPVLNHSFVCDYCERSFSKKCNLVRHIESIHTSISSYERRKIVCPICNSANVNKKFATRKLLREHCEKEHGVEFQEETKLFSSMSDFENWRLDIQRRTRCRYIRGCGIRHLANGVMQYYLHCHRDGFFKSKSKSIRKLKSQGSNKINAICFAQMTVTQNTDGSVAVKHINTHSDHDFNNGRPPLTKEERASIAEKVKDGVPFDTILDQIRNSINDTYADSALACLKKQDIRNIRRDFQLHKGRQCPNDFIKVKLWVEKVRDLGEKNPVLYFEERGHNEVENLATKVPEDNDMTLIIANDFQLHMLESFGDNIVCIGSTYGANMRSFHLTTLFVVDEFGNGIPAAFCLSNKKNIATWTVFFEKIRDRLGLLQPEVFMSDIDDSFYNAWANVMHLGQSRLLCTWHVDRAWKTNLQEKIRNKKRRALIYKRLRSLLHETDPDKFVKLVEGFRVDIYGNDDTNEFALYFDNFYVKRVEEWAHCYRKASLTNINVHFESVHNIFKQCSLQGRKNKRLDVCIDALLRLAGDHYFKRLRKLCKNRPVEDQTAILQSHQRAKNENLRLTQISDEVWRITSSTNANVSYEVMKLLNEKETCSENGDCFCFCDLCQICIHNYSCECVDYVINNNICEHIHFCVQVMLKPDLIREDFSETNADNILILEPYFEFVDESSSNDLLSSIKLKLETCLSYVSDETRSDADFSSETLHSVIRQLDCILEIFSVSEKQCITESIITETVVDVEHANLD